MIFVASGGRPISANEMIIITIARKIPYRSPLHDKVCEEKLHPRMK
jgi:hypothetical protein